MATLWTWSFSDYAEWFSGSHLFGIEATPSKAAGFAVAGEIFRALDRDQPLAFASATGDTFDGFVIDQQRDLAISLREGWLIHSGPIGEGDLPEGFRPKRILGRGASPFVETDGTGLYFVELGDGEGRLQLLPDAAVVREPWLWWMDGQPVTRIERDKPIRFALQLPGVGDVVLRPLPSDTGIKPGRFTFNFRN